MRLSLTGDQARPRLPLPHNKCFVLVTSGAEWPRARRQVEAVSSVFRAQPLFVLVTSSGMEQHEDSRNLAYPSIHLKPPEV